MGGGLGYVGQPSFASGRVCLSNMIDSIFGEAYRKPYVIPVVQRLLLGPQHDDDDDDEDAGEEYVNARARLRHCVGARLCGHSESCATGCHSEREVVRMHQVPVPSAYEGKAFVKLLGHLLHDRVRHLSASRQHAKLSHARFMHRCGAPTLCRSKCCRLRCTEVDTT